MTLRRAVDWVHGARYAGQKNGLENMRALLRALGNPQDGLRFLHVAGTNGKGSVCAFLERALRECGYKTGLYTSPYLCEYAERVRVNGVPLDDETLLRLILRVKRAAEDLVARGECFPTTFELGTAIAFLAFAEAKTDWAVIEVGLGGRLDSTNVIAPRACAISAIGMDHMKTLGDTLEAIAREKAGILKHGVPAAIHPANGSVLPCWKARRVRAARRWMWWRSRKSSRSARMARGSAFAEKPMKYRSRGGTRWATPRWRWLRWAWWAGWISPPFAQVWQKLGGIAGWNGWMAC